MQLNVKHFLIDAVNFSVNKIVKDVQKIMIKISSFFEYLNWFAMQKF